MLKKKLSILLFLLLFILLSSQFTVSFAGITRQQIIDYLTYVISENTANSGSQRLYDLYINYTNQFNNLFSTGDNGDIAIGTMQGSNTKTFIMINYYQANSLATMNSSDKLVFNTGGNNTNANSMYRLYYNGSTWSLNNYTSSTDSWPGSSIIFDSYKLSQQIIDSLKNNSYGFNTQREWTFIVNRGGNLPVYSNGYQWVSAFDIRIGQDWLIEDTDINIYTLENGEKVYHNNIARQFEQASGTNQYIVNLDTTNIENGETYYIELKLNGNVWRTNGPGQQIIVNSSSSGDSGGGGSSGGSVDLTETNNKIDLVNSSIIAQTQAIISGDRSIVDAIRSGDVAIINAITNSNYSGELALSDLPQIDIDDPTYDFFQWLLAHFQAFFTNFDNTTLVIPLWDTNYEIASNIFILNVEPLKTFISIAWWFVCGIPLLKWIRHTIETVRSGNIPQVDDKSDLLGNVL